MNHSIRLLSALAVGFSAMALSQPAHAEDFSLHLDPGVVAPLTSPQSDIYNPGLGLGAKLMFNLRPWLTVGPSLSSIYLPYAVDNGKNAGVLWQFGGSLRLQKEFDDGYSAIRPWVDLDVSLAHTGVISLPAVDLGLGIEAALDHNHSAWIGPFLRYTQVFQTAKEQDGLLLDRHDPAMLWAGLEVSFDFPTKARVSVVHDTVVRTVHDSLPVVTITYYKTETQVLPDSLDVGKVYFNWDSPKLRSWEETDKIDQLVAILKAHPQALVRVQGHASPDGQRLHNEVLSGNRTGAVVTYLIAHGVDPRRIRGEAQGVDHPSHDNGTQEGRERNRRVEFVVNYTSVDTK